MATIEMLDLRRTDQRTNVRINPFWMTSAPIDWSNSEALGACLFSFPTAGEDYVISNMMLEIVTLFAGGTPSMTIGSGTLDSDDVTTGGDITIVAADTYFLSSDITEATAGYYFPTVTMSADETPIFVGSTFGKARAASGGVSITGVANTLIPCIYAAVADTTLTAGVARLHVLLSKIQ